MTHRCRAPIAAAALVLLAGCPAPFPPRFSANGDAAPEVFAEASSEPADAATEGGFDVPSDAREDLGVSDTGPVADASDVVSPDGAPDVVGSDAISDTGCGLTMCSGVCIDTQSDCANCGSCGNVCTMGLCLDGVCYSGPACKQVVECGSTTCAGCLLGSHCR